MLCYCLLSDGQSNIDSLRKHVVKLTSYTEARNIRHPESLLKAATYIREQFALYTRRTAYQKFEADNQIYQNVLASFGSDTGKRIIIGAHYDVCGDVPGADDNASGIAGLLEIARLLHLLKTPLPFRIDLVAYALEEPPYFNTPHMGSFHHAKSLRDHQIPVLGMINLECIGFFTDRRHAQHYPFFLWRWMHGSRANFITTVQRWGHSAWSSRMRYVMKQYSPHLRVVNCKPLFGKKYTALSDHKNYWEMDFPAMMITNTAFLRNPNYHKVTDQYETLDFFRMAQVVDMVFQSVIRFKE